jgi:pyridoxal phosphate-dependent aminotransferase EpsN
MNIKIPLSATPIDYERLNEVLKRYHNQPLTSVITDFEELLRSYSGREVVAVNSGTAAIHLGLRALNVSKGDYVIAPTFTYIATVNPVLYTGAEPVFVDCDPSTWNMDHRLLEEAVVDLIAKGKRPKAIIIVHTYGMPQQMDDILKISKRFEIPVLEDAAEAIGTQFKGKPAGSFGEIGILSFNNNKTFTTYGGGAVLCHSRQQADKILFWATQSREAKPYYVHNEVGNNYRMSALNAAMGVGYWSDLQANVEERKSVFRAYKEALGPLGYTFPMPESNEPNRWLSVVLFPEKKGADFKEKAIQILSENGIEVRHLWNPLHLQPLFTGCNVYGGQAAEFLFHHGVCLPSGKFTNPVQLQEVIRILRSI